ncbi:FecR domain-containing protein [Croceicoccus sp. YJ47]|uniref:FecR family protein n=1 Tax=Croceicoccus sp. YJ47 TaxID=2798724 RepID=UPI001920691E|nr:FecR domain-containing protein [Croceicoccus sp. YJ47]QQN74315.1 FecR domain-containing protein [Croceicoccus sp. YJ47]
MTIDDTVRNEAAAWAVRTVEDDFDDWGAFTAWLEQSPDHARAYDLTMAAAADGAQAFAAELRSTAPGSVSPPVPANDFEPVFDRAPRRWLGPAMAACLAVVAALWLWQWFDRATVYHTEAGEMRNIALADGSTIRMAGATRLALDAGETRHARLEQGQAVFDIRHDEDNPFEVEIGGARLVDAGTVFEVTVRDAEVDVAVAEGAVIYNPAGQGARIEAGQTLVFARDGHSIRRGTMPVAQIGEWTTGRLTFQDAPLSRVADDLSRATGHIYRVGRGADGHVVSGSVTIDPLRSDPASAGPLLGLNVRREGDIWLLDRS